MPTERFEFLGAERQKLAARLDIPAGETRAYALFAHCFTGGKDILAASRIGQALATRGIAVLRFDFTGLGASEGEFSNTNFSSNLADLTAAANYLRQTYRAPSMLIGHSLGGSAVLAAASKIPEVRGVVTIGAPSDPAHVKKQFRGYLDEIQTNGEAVVKLSGRSFRIKRQFLIDAEKQRLLHNISEFNGALLVMHSPQDETVAVQNASHIFSVAKHPKSFVSLDDADHLLTRKSDALYAANVIAAWGERYIIDDVKKVQRS
ncbi:putative redox protein [Collimonas sp. OK307]|uniref:alpha/beta hydrolase family protein n=1 Tax=Collimonas sp. OK307 TaxID=1801620 RepID=UPI0008ED5614|nr:alpha/beta hydrolase [Collimonas sp. OK307]SFI42200.1 putative redox protein [Collimonas sp. OK307]